MTKEETKISLLKEAMEEEVEEVEEEVEEAMEEEKENLLQSTLLLWIGELMEKSPP